VIAELAGQLPMQQAATGRRPLAFVGGASRASITPQIQKLLAEGFGRD